MPQFTLSQLLMGTALLAIILGFTQSEGCGTRYMMIEAISFTSDDSRIAVAKLTARDARTPFKAYKADVSRTVSWLDASTGSGRGIIHQDYEAGNCGPAFRLWRVGRTSVLCDPSNDHVAMSAFGGGDVTRNLGSEKPVVETRQRPAFNIAYSKSGRYLAASGECQLTVLDSQDDTVVMRVEANDLPFLSASLMSFTNDDTRIVVAGDSGVHVWHIPTSTQVSTIIQASEESIRGISVAPEDSLIVCSESWVRRYDLTGRILATLGDKGGYFCCVSAEGNLLAVCGDDQVTIYDLSSNKALRSLPFQRVTAVALSSSGDELAVGDYDGQVTLIETATGARRWRSNPPGRYQYRYPWMMSAAALAGWAYVAWRMSRRPKVAAIRDLEPARQNETHH